MEDKTPLKLEELEFEEANKITPRYQCREYIQCHGGEAIALRKTYFDKLFREKEFGDGPYRDTFGDNPGEPYNPDRQAFGTLKNGRVVYCEINKPISQ